MEKALKREFGLSGKAKAGIAAGMALFLLMSVFVYAKLYSGIRDVVIRKTIYSVTNVSELNADAVSRSLKNRQKLLETFAVNLSSSQSNDTEKILSRMAAYKDVYEFYNLGILSKDFSLRLTTGETFDASKIPQYRQAMEEGRYISASFLPADGGAYRVNLITAPVYYGEELEYLITATCISRDLTQRMNISVLKNQGYNLILNTQGEVTIYPEIYADEAYLNLMKYVNDATEILPDESGDTRFLFDGEMYYAHFERLSVNDWYLMTCAKEKDVFGDAHLIMRTVFLGMGVLWLQLVLALLFILYLFWHSKKKTQRAVFYDDLLQIGNGEFLRVFFEKMPDRIRSRMALIAFDIDKFKEFNYLYGEECGDNLLRYITQAFQEELPEDYLFRYMADDFIALIRQRDQSEVSDKLQRLLQRFSEDMERGVIQPFDISAGVRLIGENEPFRRIMSDALLAKGTVKGIHVQQFAFYDEQLRSRRMSYMEMESDFARALRDQEFQVYYQPKYDMRTGRIVGAEALARWIRPDGTVISPGMFIPCFEASRQVILLDEAMLEAVCRQMKEMEAEGLAVRRVSVNLSRVHLRHPGILTKIERIIRTSGIRPEMISFEITESALYEDSIPLKHIVGVLHSLGCRVDMDDYGVGVSGPNALVENEFDVVKMDKSFIDRIGDRKTEAVIRSTIRLSQELGIEILAEGVEQQYQAEKLVEWGCDTAQGFYYSCPVPEEEYRRLLKLEGVQQN